VNEPTVNVCARIYGFSTGRGDKTMTFDAARYRSHWRLVGEKSTLQSILEHRNVKETLVEIAGE